MTYPTDHENPTQSGTAAPSAETSTNSLAPCTPSSYPDPSPAPDLEKGPQGEEDKVRGEDDGRAPEVASQSSRTVTLAARLSRFSDTFLERLPYWVAHFLGYRKSEPKVMHPLLAIVWAFVGVVGSIMLISLATERIAVFRDHGAPVIVASFVRP